MATGAVMRIPVAIVGGGPVGLILALFLDFHGIRAVVFNSEETTRWHPKGSTENARTMEHFRRLGIADRIRELGLPPDHPTDVAYFTRFAGKELARIRMPSRNDALRKAGAAGKMDQVPEPIHRANQMHVEQFLLEYARTRKNLTVRFGWNVESFQQDADRVRIIADRRDDPRRETWEAQYLVGADGGRSAVRRSIGIAFRGEAGLEQRYFGGRMYSTYVRAPTLYRDFLAKRRAWQYWAVNPEIHSSLIAVNGHDEFLFRVRASNPDKPPTDAAIAAAMRRCVGTDIPLHILAHEPWTAGMALVAESFGRGRMLLAGDAAHLFTPTGGFGMNTGVDDAANLAWKLAAVLQGWGGGELLSSYETERMPIALRNTEAARQLTANISTIDIDPAIEADSPGGEAARRAVGEILAGFGEQFASLGVQLGTRYDGSPLIVADTAPPSDSWIVYTPSSIPGGRAPHVWLADEHVHGNSLYDRLGSGFTLLRLGPHAPETSELCAEAARLNIPLKTTRIADADVRDFYGCDLALVRPDQHVAWRGNEEPQECGRLLRQLVGYAV